MKLKCTLALAAILSFAIGFTGCKKDGDVVRIQKVVPQKIIDDLKSRGMIINEGTKPPTLDDAYFMSPYELLSPFGPDDDFEVGDEASDYYYKFYGQNEKNEVLYDYMSAQGGDHGEAQGAFIAGDGKKFTIFSEETSVSSGIPNKSVTIISGELTSKGIRNFQYAFVIKEKDGDDDDEVLVAVNKGRVWIDGDYISETTNYLRTAGSGVQKRASFERSVRSRK
ncbi:hypothetical protein SAMN05216327_10237 [Dyadobacter sp. SG02]|uniref:hypothetical protein n=1 Tax=Dyadobacter sp. SG02 TaxID=1855291 RepID=UPI0008AB951B|nr:hypothetical protein [Dyadobacter sp. SG02]SEI49711.1 hypothetical protein SAMN05216327_10237 [Dyadobacter sp. SG02]